MKKSLREKALVSYEELTKDYSHFEIAFLSFQKALELIRTASYLKIADSAEPSKKPKVAVVAMKSLCDDPEYARNYKNVIMQHFFEQDDEEDSYNVDNIDSLEENQEN